MLSRSLGPGAGRTDGTRNPWPALLGVGLVAAVGSRDAVAANLGSLAASTGLLATLLAIFAIKGWPAVVSAETASTAGGALLLAVAAAWLAPGRRGREFRVRNARSLRSPSPDLAVLSARGIDVGDLKRELIRLFARVQHAWDQAELAALRDSTTPEMLVELMQERAHCLASSDAVRTRIVTVEAELLGYEELMDAAVVTVAFSGSMCEGSGRSESPFREVWLLTKPVDAVGSWKLARHQSLY